jgi:hypothetical protein
MSTPVSKIVAEMVKLSPANRPQDSGLLTQTTFSLNDSENVSVLVDVLLRAKAASTVDSDRIKPNKPKALRWLRDLVRIYSSSFSTLFVASLQV